MWKACFLSEKKPSVTHWESLHRLIGRKNAVTEVHDFDNLLPDSQSDLEPAAASQPHQTQPDDSSSRAPVDPVDLSSDDDEVENLLEHAFEDAQTTSVPSFNPLSSLPVRGSSEWPKSGLLPAGDGGEKEEIEEDTRDMGSADDFNDNQPRRSPRKAKIIAIQREKSTSTMVKDKNTKTIQKKKSVPMITEKRLQANRELLIGQKIKRFSSWSWWCNWYSQEIFCFK